MHTLLWDGDYLNHSVTKHCVLWLMFVWINRNPELAAVCRHSKTLLLYPGEEAQNLQEMNADFVEDVQNVIIIDGTWSQAKDMFLKNSLFHLPKQVCLLLVLNCYLVCAPDGRHSCIFPRFHQHVYHVVVLYLFIYLVFPLVSILCFNFASKCLMQSTCVYC